MDEDILALNTALQTIIAQLALRGVPESRIDPYREAQKHSRYLKSLLEQPIVTRSYPG